jgi:hypothetical protein
VRDLDQPAAIGFAFAEASLRKARVRAVHAWQLFLPEMRLTGTERPGAAAEEVTAGLAEWLTGLHPSRALPRRRHPRRQVRGLWALVSPIFLCHYLIYLAIRRPGPG